MIHVAVYIIKSLGFGPLLAHLERVLFLDLLPLLSLRLAETLQAALQLRLRLLPLLVLVLPQLEDILQVDLSFVALEFQLRGRFMLGRAEGFLEDRADLCIDEGAFVVDADCFLRLQGLIRSYSLLLFGPLPQRAHPIEAFANPVAEKRNPSVAVSLIVHDESEKNEQEEEEQHKRYISLRWISSQLPDWGWGRGCQGEGLAQAR